MQRWFYLFIMAGAVLALSSQALAQSTTAGKTGVAFLKVGVGGRGAALGEAVVAQPLDASAAYWNPAGLATAKNEGYFAHSEWLQGIKNDFLAVKFNGLGAAWAVSIQLQNIAGIEQRQGPTAEPTAEITARDAAFGLSYARSFGENVQIGATLKYLSERIVQYEASGFALDAGVRYTLPALGGLSLAASLHNLGKMGALQQDDITLPAFVRYGVAYAPDFNASFGEFEFFLAGRTLFAGSTTLGAGVEFKTLQRFVLRLGYQGGREAQSLSAGVGFSSSRFRLDYAYVPFEFDLGDTHRLSLGIAL